MGRRGGEHYTSLQFVNTENDGKGAVHLHPPSEHKPAAVSERGSSQSLSDGEPFKMTRQPPQRLTCILKHSAREHRYATPSPTRGVLSQCRRRANY